MPTTDSKPSCPKCASLDVVPILYGLPVEEAFEQAKQRRIRPVACFPAGRYVYVRAHCSMAEEMRTFRVDRIEMA